MELTISSGFAYARVSKIASENKSLTWFSIISLGIIISSSFAISYFWGCLVYLLFEPFYFNVPKTVFSSLRFWILLGSKWDFYSWFLESSDKSSIKCFIFSLRRDASPEE